MFDGRYSKSIGELEHLKREDHTVETLPLAKRQPVAFCKCGNGIYDIPAYLASLNIFQCHKCLMETEIKNKNTERGEMQAGRRLKLYKTSI